MSQIKKWTHGWRGLHTDFLIFIEAIFIVPKNVSSEVSRRCLNLVSNVASVVFGVSCWVG